MTAAPPHSFHDISTFTPSPEILSDAEKRWVSFQPYLLSRGYQLRPRYRPEWFPSWKRTGADPSECEDSINRLPIRVLDATRTNDNLQVFIKMLVPSIDDREGEEELEILERFSSSPYIGVPTNHVVPCLDSFPIPGVENGVFIVMPLLIRYKRPPFCNLSELHSFLSQIFEGLAFMHEHDVAHCDIASPNIMMDGHPLYGEPFHPVTSDLSRDGTRYIRPRNTRYQAPVNYYYIDLGYAKWFKDSNIPRLVTGTRARERVPEQLAGEPYDPFRADVYQLGAFLRRELIPEYTALSFLLPLARDMTNSDPIKRPDINFATYTMNTCFAGLRGWRTRWPIIPPHTAFKHRCLYIIHGISAELVFLLREFFELIFLRG